MGECYITRRGTTIISANQLGVFPTGDDGRPTGQVTVLENVTNLSKLLFIENSSVLSVILPNSLESIADYSFQRCTGLQNVTIPNKVTTIPQYCFDGCSELKSVTLSNNSIIINQFAFKNCTKLYNVIIPDDTESIVISKYAFYGCESLGNEIITKLATKATDNISIYAFANLTGITEITTAKVTDYYFSGCTNLEKVTILNSNINGGFGGNVFSGCKNLTTVILPENATKIDVSMFYGNSKLNNLNLPNSLESIGSRAFYNCSSLTSIYLPNKITTIKDAAFYGCTSLKSIYLPSSITTITDNNLTSTSSSYYVFYNCTALEDVQLGQDWNMSLRLNVSNNLTVDSMVAMFNSLKDLTGETAKTLTLGETNLAKLTDEQKAIAINKNWTLA